MGTNMSKSQEQSLLAFYKEIDKDGNGISMKEFSVIKFAIKSYIICCYEFLIANEFVFVNLHFHVRNLAISNLLISLFILPLNIRIVLDWIILNAILFLRMSIPIMMESE